MTQVVQQAIDECEAHFGSEANFHYDNVLFAWEGATSTPVSLLDIRVNNTAKIAEKTIEIIQDLNEKRRLQNDVIIAVGGIVVPVLRDPPFALPKDVSDFLDLFSFLCNIGDLDAHNVLGTCELIELLRAIIEGDDIIDVVESVLGTHYPRSCPDRYVVSIPENGNDEHIRFFSPIENEKNRCVWLPDVAELDKTIAFFFPGPHNYGLAMPICFGEETNCSAAFIDQLRRERRRFQAPFLHDVITGNALAAVANSQNPLVQFMCSPPLPLFRPRGPVIEGIPYCLGLFPFTPNPIEFVDGVIDQGFLLLGDSAQHCVANRTLPGHTFHPGHVERCFSTNSVGDVFARTEGRGDGLLPDFNDWVGPRLIMGLDRQLRKFYCSRPGISCVPEG